MLKDLQPIPIGLDLYEMIKDFWSEKYLQPSDNLIFPTYDTFDSQFTLNDQLVMLVALEKEVLTLKKARDTLLELEFDFPSPKFSDNMVRKSLKNLANRHILIETHYIHRRGYNYKLNYHGIATNYIQKEVAHRETRWKIDKEPLDFEEVVALLFDKDTPFSKAIRVFSGLLAQQYMRSFLWYETKDDPGNKIEWDDPVSTEIRQAALSLRLELRRLLQLMDSLIDSKIWSDDQFLHIGSPVEEREVMVQLSKSIQGMWQSGELTQSGIMHAGYKESANHALETLVKKVNKLKEDTDDKAN